MKMEPLLQIQETMLKKSLSDMKKCLVANQRRPEQHLWQETIQKMTYLIFLSRPNQTISNNCWAANLAFWIGEI